MTKKQALKDVETPLVLYLTEVAKLSEASTQEEKETFDLTSQNRLRILEGALTGARQRYEVPELTDLEVLKHGVSLLNSRYQNFRHSPDQRDRDIAETVETAMLSILNGDAVTLRTLLAEARDYQS